MIRLIDLRDNHADPRLLVPRAHMDVAEALDRITPIIEDIRVRGAEAVSFWSEKLDGVTPPTLKVPTELMSECARALDPTVRLALEESIRRARLVHSDQCRTEVVTEVVSGGSVTERWVPVDRVGLYVPGGRPYTPAASS